MKVAVLGGGPAGLYFAISMKLRDAAHEVTVYERNRPDDTFGWGVVLSDETLDNLAGNDPAEQAGRLHGSLLCQRTANPASARARFTSAMLSVR